MDFTAPKLAANKRQTWNSIPGVNVRGRVFHAFDHWALVPAADLLVLRHAIESLNPAATGEANAILHLVDDELRRRSAVLPPAGQVS